MLETQSYTKSNAVMEANRQNAKLAGRPAGSLNKNTLLKIKKEAEMQKVFLKNAKKIAEEQVKTALGNGEPKDWRAGKDILDRTFGEATKNINSTIAVFSLKSLKDIRSSIKEEAIDITDKSEIINDVDVSE